MSMPPPTPGLPPPGPAPGGAPSESTGPASAGYQQFRPADAAPRSGLATASLVLSIVGIPMCLLLVPSLLGLIFGIVGWGQTADGQRPGRGLAIAGTIVGATFLAIGIVVWILLLTVGDCETRNGEFTCEF